MKKATKFLALAMTAAMATATVFSATSCAKEENIIRDGKTVNVRINKSGWSDEYFTAWCNAFKSIYAEEGYKVNVVEAKPTIQATVVTNELLQKDKNGIDLYLAGQIGVDSIVTLSEQEGFTLTEDLTDVMNSPAIDADGNEESVKIVDKLRAGYVDRYLVNSTASKYQKYNNKWWYMPVGTTTQSFVVNKTLLKNTFGLDLPLTTGDLLHAFDVINAKYKETKIKPTVWAGNNAYRYWDSMHCVWYAQYSGLDQFNKFVDLNVNSVDEMKALYDEKGFVRSIELMETMLDLDNAVDGTIDFTHDFSQHKLLTGEAVFQPNGAWLETEMGAGYKDAMKDIVMIKMPIVSELGVKLGLDGANGTNAAKCEEVLKVIIAAVDEEKTADTIISEVSTKCGVTVTADQVEAVRTARGIYYGDNGRGGFYVNPYSKMKEVTKLFLRFCASDEAIAYYRMMTGGTMAYVPEDESVLESIEISNYAASVDKLINADKAVGINIASRPASKRSMLGLVEFNAGEYGGSEWIKSMANNSSITAAKLIAAEKDIVAAKLK